LKKKKTEEENPSAQPEKAQELTKEEMEATAEVTGDNLNSTDEERAPFKEKAENKAMLGIFSKNSSETISQKSEKDKDKKAGEFYKASGEEFAKIHNLLKKSRSQEKAFRIER